MICKKDNNLKNCPCTYESCHRKGICCECIAYHKEKDQLPACYFSPQAEKSFDRSIEKFLQDKNI